MVPEGECGPAGPHPGCQLAADTPRDANPSEIEARDAATAWDSCAHPAEDVSVKGGLPEFLDLNITGVGFQAHEAQRIRVVTFDPRDGTPLGDGIATIRDGTFYLHFPNGYYEFSYQRVFYYVDVNGDGQCDVASGDHAAYTVTSAQRVTAYEYSLSEREPHEAPARAASVCGIVNSCRVSRP
jgi:hypothetical protein